jgi:uncharacterized protein involved in cysteine biosynthesis
VLAVHRLFKGGYMFWRGCVWLKNNPLYLFVLFIPIFLAVTAIGFAWGFFWKYDADLFAWLLPKGQGLFGGGVYYLSKIAIYFSVLILAPLLCVLMANILSSPFYEFVSLRVERDYGVSRDFTLSFSATLKLYFEEIKKLLFIFTISIIFLIIPGFHLLSPLISVFLIGWEFYDFPCARRGWGYKRRLYFVLNNFWGVVGLGCFAAIPFLCVITMPLAVVGGTMLAVEDIQQV